MNLSRVNVFLEVQKRNLLHSMISRKFKNIEALVRIAMHWEAANQRCGETHEKWGTSKKRIHFSKKRIHFEFHHISFANEKANGKANGKRKAKNELNESTRSLSRSRAEEYKEVSKKWPQISP